MAKVSKKQYLIEDTVIIDQIYPLVEATMSSKCSALKSCIERFIHSRQASLYDYAPVDRIFFKKSDVNDFFKSIIIPIFCFSYWFRIEHMCIDIHRNIFR